MPGSVIDNLWGSDTMSDRMSNVKLAQKVVNLTQALDAKAGLLAELGASIDGYEVYNDDVLLATYIPPENMKDGHLVTLGGIMLPQKKTDEKVGEHIFQGKVGLILAKGPVAFVADSTGCKFEGRVPDIHEWVVFRPSDSWSISFNGVSCRIVRSALIRGAVSDPSVIW